MPAPCFAAQHIYKMTSNLSAFYGNDRLQLFVAQFLSLSLRFLLALFTNFVLFFSLLLNRLAASVLCLLEMACVLLRERDTNADQLKSTTFANLSRQLEPNERSKLVTLALLATLTSASVNAHTLPHYVYVMWHVVELKQQQQQ